jgi:hypothetical protein
MGRLWCEGFPIVEMPRRDIPKPLTVIYPYYENARFLARQLDHWLTLRLSSDVAAMFSAIVVDDGSPNRSANEVLGGQGHECIRLFRLYDDIRWNWLAARNIGFHHAPEGWCLVTDMDHMIPEATLRSVLYSEHDPSVIYAFRRFDVRGGDAPVEIAPHPNSWLMTREMFWTVGGYDETLSGHYGTDGDWRRRCAKVAPIEILTDVLHRHEYDGDSSTTHYLRKQPQDAKVKQIVAARGKGWKPKTLSFPYHEVQLMEAVCPP